MTFKASNGIEIVFEDGYPRFTWRGENNSAGDRLEALAEYFESLNDKALGRWRDSESPRVVCYPFDDGVLVIDESTGANVWWSRERVERSGDDFGLGYETAVRYFDALDKSKPWLSANDGDVWVIVHENGVEAPAFFHKGLFSSGDENWWATDVDEAYKIWPTEA